MSAHVDDFNVSYSSEATLDDEVDVAGWRSDCDLIEECVPAEPAIPECAVAPFDPRAWAIVAASLSVVLGSGPAKASPPATAPTEGPRQPEVESPWLGLIDRRVELLLRDPAVRLRGIVLSYQGEVLAIATEPDAELVFVDAHQILGARVLEEDLPQPPRRGDPLVMLGAIATSFGAALSIGGIALAAGCAAQSGEFIDANYCDYSVWFSAAGGVGLATGIPLLAVGLRKRKQAEEATGSNPSSKPRELSNPSSPERQLAITPVVALSPFGGALGVTLKF